MWPKAQKLIGWLALFAVRHKKYIWKNICCIDSICKCLRWSEQMHLSHFFFIKMFIINVVCTEHLSLCEQALIWVNFILGDLVPSFTLFILYLGSEASRTPSDFWAKCCHLLVNFTVLGGQYLYTEHKAPHLTCGNIYF